MPMDSNILGGQSVGEINNDSIPLLSMDDRPWRMPIDCQSQLLEAIGRLVGILHLPFVKVNCCLNPCKSDQRKQKKKGYQTQTTSIIYHV
jgi:hypothetical protein